MSRVDEVSPDASPSRSATSGNPSRLKLTAIVSGLLGMLMFCLLPVLPVQQDQTSYSWPQGGDLRSVTSPLMAYQPEKLDITLPVSEVRDLNPRQTTVLSTVPEDSEDQTLRGLFVRSTPNGLDVVNRNSVLLTLDQDTVNSLPDGSVLRVYSDFTKSRAWIPAEGTAPGDPDGAALVGPDGEALEGADIKDMRPMLTGIYTEMADTPENTQDAVNAGLKVDVTVDSRFTSSPSVTKYTAALLGLIFTVISLAALHRMDCLDGKTKTRHRFLPENWWRPRWLDAVVGVVLLVWYFIGANTSDDGYLLTMARVSVESGYMANYYRWFGVPESPFGAPYYDLLALMTHVSSASIWIRLPELIAGFLVWMLLSREVLPRLGAPLNRRKVAHWTAAAVFLVFWMTFNNGTRPEPVIALGALLTWVCMERAIATSRLLPAAFGVIVASLSLAAGPTGLMAVAALLAALSGLIRIVIRRLPGLGAPKGASRWRIAGAVLAQVAPFLAAGTAVLICVFGDQTLRTVIEAIRVRSAVGPALSWYDEPVRYTELLKQTVDGSFPRRFSVLMMIFCLGVVIASMLRNRRIPGTANGPAVRLTLVVIGTMFFMTFTPTKWTHHFGVYAGLAAGLAALAAVAASTLAMRSARNRIVFLGATLLLFAFCLSGTNGWWYISSFGVPWFDKSIQIGGIEASTVMMVLSVLVMFFGVLVGFRSDIREANATTASELAEVADENSAEARRLTKVAAAPIAVLTSVVVLFNLASLGKGFLAQWPAYTVGKGNVEALTGDTCNLASDVRVESDTNSSFLTPADGRDLRDSLVDSSTRGFDPNNIPADLEDDGDDSGTGSPATAATTSGTFGSSDEATNGDGTSGGLQATVGVNGSYATLPFGIDRSRVPVVGSYTDGLQEVAGTTTSWYTLPERRADAPLLVISAAGIVAHNDINGVYKYGQDITVEYGRSTGGTGENSFEVMGEIVPMDIETSPQWRNLRVPMDQIPADADVVRIVAEDRNVTPNQWLAFTPPRVPTLVDMNDIVTPDVPALIDWGTPLQFPCQRPFDHRAGVAEIAQFQISPDHTAKKEHSPVQSYYGGGAGGLMQMTTRAEEMPTYLQDDWQRDWGVLSKLTVFTSSTGETPKTAEVDSETVSRSGLWFNGPMKFDMN
ncbi:putative arabinosyltransferase C [Corynebacterium provencense]|uniref:Putative arabinosyltransferase C n=1 Tax=Corynebacterium provencense TaxID=1737425 RepID=A0A2Z3Z145_9CORY|nr:arabinosyltransferase domain-containing protein [Corynebacterium provencense]AWT27323.1 putative arabinosyltransferase C [Corynebacterium provencense]